MSTLFDLIKSDFFLEEENKKINKIYLEKKN